jgi:hypothetical protein
MGISRKLRPCWDYGVHAHHRVDVLVERRGAGNLALPRQATDDITDRVRTVTRLPVGVALEHPSLPVREDLLPRTVDRTDNSKIRVERLQLGVHQAHPRRDEQIDLPLQAARRDEVREHTGADTSAAEVAAQPPQDM